MSLFETMSDELVDAIRTMREYGLGWGFMSQTLGSLHRDVIDQIGIYSLGYGLQWGSEFQAPKEIFAGVGQPMGLHQSFQDPGSSLKTPKYPFMAEGPVSPHSFPGYPLFFNALNYPEEFLGVNIND